MAIKLKNGSNALLISKIFQDNVIGLNFIMALKPYSEKWLNSSSKTNIIEKMALKIGGKALAENTELIGLLALPMKALELIDKINNGNLQVPINLQPLSMGAGQSFTREFIPEFDESSELKGVSDAEVAKDNQEFLDYMKMIDLSTGS